MKTITFNGRKMPFQTGIITAILSAIGLQKHLQEYYDIPLLKCEAITQDWLERIHGILRQMGLTYMRPTPLSYLHRLRRFLIEKFLGELKKLSQAKILEIWS